MALYITNLFGVWPQETWVSPPTRRSHPLPPRAMARRRTTGEAPTGPTKQSGATAHPAGSKGKGKGKALAMRKRVARAATVPNFLDPMCPFPAPSVISSGKALAHTGLVSADFVVGVTNTTILVVTNVGSAGTVGVILNVSPAGDFVDGLKVLTIPTLAAADEAGGPSAARAMKVSASVVNCTNALKRGGRVTYLNSSQRLPPISGVNPYAAMVSGIKNSPYRRRITGDTLTTPSHLIAFPTDSIAYNTFDSFHGTLTHDEFWQHVVTASTGVEPMPRPMSCIAYVFDPASDPQDYSLTVRAAYYTRWPLTSVPGQSMKPIPTAPAPDINAVHDHAESKANDLAHVAEGGLLATVAPRVMSAVRTAGGALLNRMGGVVNAVEGVAAEGLGAEGLALAEAAVPLLL